MTADQKAALELTPYQRPAGVHPPLDSPGYRSTQLRAPRHKLVPLPHWLTEVTGPRYGSDPVTAADADLTTRHADGPLGERIITDQGVLQPDPATCELVLTGIYPGASVSEIRASTGWDLQVAADLTEIAPPSDRELTALRGLLATVPAKTQGPAEPAHQGATR